MCRQCLCGSIKRAYYFLFFWRGKKKKKKKTMSLTRKGFVTAVGLHRSCKLQMFVFVYSIYTSAAQVFVCTQKCSFKW